MSRYTFEQYVRKQRRDFRKSPGKSHLKAWRTIKIHGVGQGWWMGGGG